LGNMRDFFGGNCISNFRLQEWWMHRSPQIIYCTVYVSLFSAQSLLYSRYSTICIINFKREKAMQYTFIRDKNKNKFLPVLRSAKLTRNIDFWNAVVNRSRNKCTDIYNLLQVLQVSITAGFGFIILLLKQGHCC
jgi:hypothetical protein